MKKIIALAAVAALGLAAYAKSSTPNGFTDDLDAAIKAAKASGKTVLAVFSGSDWCHWCKVLEKDYLSKSEFVEEASKKFELVFIDSPQDKSVLSETAKAKNPELTKKYGIRGFPTLKYIDAEGNASDAPRARDLTPKAYAEKLAKELELAPVIAKHITPIEAEFHKIMNESMKAMRAEGNFFAKETEEAQRESFNKVIASVRESLGAVKALVVKFEAAEIPAEIADKKTQLLGMMKGTVSGMEKYVTNSFEDSLKEYKKWTEASKKKSKDSPKRKGKGKGAKPVKDKLAK